MKQWIAVLFVLMNLFACHEDSQPGTTKQAVKPPTHINEVHYNNGKQLFMRNCATCHLVNRDMSGPALAGVTHRWPSDRILLRAFIKNSDSVIKVNPYAQELWKKWNEVAMNKFPLLADSSIDHLLYYIETYAATQP
jgi:cytochrome c2